MRSRLVPGRKRSTRPGQLGVWPNLLCPSSTIVVPGGPGYQAAERLAEEGRARYLVISQAQCVPLNPCGTYINTTSVICFQPSPVPATPQGEAEATVRLAKQDG